MFTIFGTAALLFTATPYAAIAVTSGSPSLLTIPTLLMWLWSSSPTPMM